MDLGITEREFWEMSLCELDRATESYIRRKKQSQQERASFDYILADLIGCSIGRIYSSTTHLPPLEETYPSLFSSEEIQEKREQTKIELSAIRFRQFATAYNKRRFESE